MSLLCPPRLLACMNSRKLVMCVILLLGTASSVARGQGFLLWQSSGSTPGTYFGWSVANAGDVNGDGFGDVIVGAPQVGPTGGPPGPGYVKVFSGASGAVLFTLTGTAVGSAFGASVANVGDVNGDAIPDLVVGVPQVNVLTATSPIGPGQAKVFSGAGGALLMTFNGSALGDRFGDSVAGAGDVNGDGVPDVVVGARAVNGFAGQVKVYSGAGGALLHTFSGTAGGDLFGYSVAGAGDVNGDGNADLFVGAPYASPGGLSVAGEAKVFSGATGGVLFTFDGTVAWGKFGSSVAGLGDVNGDLAPDVIASSQPGLYPGLVKIFSGANGAVLATLSGGGPGSGFGGKVATAGDIDGDGVPDVLVGSQDASPSGGGSEGEVTVFSGANAAPLFTLNGTATGENFGAFVAGGADVNGDGVPDVVVGATGFNPSALGSTGLAKVFSVVGIPAGATPLGAGCVGTGGFAPVISTFGGPPVIGNSAFGIALVRGLGGAPALLFLATSSNPVGLPVGGCNLYLVGNLYEMPPVTVLSGPTGVGGAGHRLKGIPVPADPALAGGVVHLQWGALDPGSPNGVFVGSNALSVTVL